MIFEFLERIKYPIIHRALPSPTYETLEKIHSHFQVNIPFENLSVYYHPEWYDPTDPSALPVKLDVDSVFQKLVTQKRGGFCMEISVLYGWALEQLGFIVQYISGKSMTPGFDPDNLVPSHCALFVTIPPSLRSSDARHAVKYLCETGTSARSALAPIPLIDGATVPVVAGYTARVRYITFGQKQGWCYELLPPYPQSIYVSKTVSDCNLTSGGSTASSEVTLANQDSSETRSYSKKVSSKDITPAYEGYHFLEDVPVDQAHFLKMLKRVTTPSTCPPYPGNTEFAVLVDKEGGVFFVLGTPKSGYKFIWRDAKGSEIERILIPGGGDDERLAIKAQEDFKILLRERFNIFLPNE